MSNGESADEAIISKDGKSKLYVLLQFVYYRSVNLKTKTVNNFCSLENKAMNSENIYLVFPEKLFCTH